MTPAHVIIPFLVSFLIMTSLALFSWQRRAEHASRIFFVFTLLVLLWLGGFILIQDITRRKEAESEKEQLYTELKASLEQTRKLQSFNTSDVANIFWMMRCWST